MPQRRTDDVQNDLVESSRRHDCDINVLHYFTISFHIQYTNSSVIMSLNNVAVTSEYRLTDPPRTPTYISKGHQPTNQPTMQQQSMHTNAATSMMNRKN